MEDNIRVYIDRVHRYAFACDAGSGKGRKEPCHIVRRQTVILKRKAAGLSFIYKSFVETEFFRVLEIIQDEEFVFLKKFDLLGAEFCCQCFFHQREIFCLGWV